MAEYRVIHRVFGEGRVIKINNGYATVKFRNEEKTFVIQGFDKYFEIPDPEFQSIVDEANKAVVKTVPPVSNYRPETPKPSYRPTFSYSAHSGPTASSLLSPRAQTIIVPNESKMFEIVGYIARPGRVGSFEAEVPADGRDDVFEELFPGQTYRPITMGDTPSGMPNKLSSQFRINFSNLRNCPDILRNNMGAGNGGCVGRINKSKFVLTLVERYGFRFGDRQNVSEIRKIAEEKGYIEDFERGYSL